MKTLLSILALCFVFSASATQFYPNNVPTRFVNSGSVLMKIPPVPPNLIPGVDVVFGTNITSSAQTYTYSFGSTGLNRMLIVSLMSYNGNASGTPTYNGVSMTSIITNRVFDATGTNVVFYLINPASGNNTLSFAVAGGGYTSFQSFILTNANQSAPVNIATTTKLYPSSATGDTNSVTSAANDLGLDFIILYRPPVTIAVGQGQTLYKNTSTAATFDLSASTKISVGTSTTMSFTNTASPSYSLNQILINMAHL
jgi:hypothetical protein